MEIMEILSSRWLEVAVAVYLIKAAGLQSTLLHRFVYSRIMFQPGCRLWNRYTRCK